MAHSTDPLPADRDGTDGRADGLDTAMRGRASMSAREYAGRVVVALSGELDVSNAAHIGAMLTTVCVRVPWLIVDLAGLEFTDCAGMRALASAAEQARQTGGGLVLAAPPPLALRVIELTDLMAGVPVYSSVQTAAGMVSPQPAARTLRGSDPHAIVAGLPTVRPERQQEEGQRDRHRPPTVADTRFHSL
ncbi:MAG: STAS domain-containing protein [Streptosporangiaceae bacterium]